MFISSRFFAACGSALAPMSVWRIASAKPQAAESIYNHCNRRDQVLNQIDSNMVTPPITIIVRHPRENPKKCSVLPLQGRDDVRILPYPPIPMPAFDGYIRLAADGPELSLADRAFGILLLDGSWRSSSKMVTHFEAVAPRSLHGWKTAYPRVSKLGTDPENGLASIEALYIAYHLLGRPTEGLLDHYHWAKPFLELNGFV